MVKIERAYEKASRTDGRPGPRRPAATLDGARDEEHDGAAVLRDLIQDALREHAR